MKYTLFEINLPWSNAEQVGNYNTIAEVNSAAIDEMNDLSSTLGCHDYVHTPIDHDGISVTESYVKDIDGEVSDDGYMFINVPYNGNCFWVFFQPNLTIPQKSYDPEIRGPYKTVDEANVANFGLGCRKKFRLAPGTFGYGYYSVERREGTYMILCANGGDSNVS